MISTPIPLSRLSRANFEESTVLCRLSRNPTDDSFDHGSFSTLYHVARKPRRTQTRRQPKYYPKKTNRQRKFSRDHAHLHEASWVSLSIVSTVTAQDLPTGQRKTKDHWSEPTVLYVNRCARPLLRRTNMHSIALGRFRRQLNKPSAKQKRTLPTDNKTFQQHKSHQRPTCCSRLYETHESYCPRPFRPDSNKTFQQVIRKTQRT